jgi:hypothetical protein
MGHLEKRKAGELSTTVSYTAYIMPRNSEDCQIREAQVFRAPNQSKGDISNEETKPFPSPRAQGGLEDLA